MQHSSETHSKTKSASMPGHYVYPGAAPVPIMQSTPIAESEQQTVQKATSFKEQKKKVSTS